MTTPLSTPFDTASPTSCSRRRARCASGSTSTARSTPQVILECIALAQQAPTGTNEQNWRWVVVTDADKKAAARRHLPRRVPDLPGAGRGRGGGRADPSACTRARCSWRRPSSTCRCW